MSVTGTIAAVAGLGAASSIAGGITQGDAAKSAAAVQEQKATQAQQLEQQNQQKGVDFQTNEWTGQQAAEQPYQALGSTAANSYTDLLNHPFTAPTLEQAEATPGYQFALDQGTQAINEHAAATGNLNSGNTGVALQQYGQGLASTTYQQAYQNAMNSWTTNLNASGQGVNTGLSSTGQLGQFGQGAANNLTNLYLTGGAQQAQQLNNQGAAVAAGDIGQANAYANMFNGVANSAIQGIAMGSGGGDSEGTFSGGSVGGVSDPGLGSPSYMNPYSNISVAAPYSATNLPSNSFAAAPSF